MTMFLIFLAFLITEKFLVQTQLSPGGANVCSRTVSYTAYNPTFKTRIGYDNYRTCCKRFLGICTSRCTRSRTKRINYYENVATTRYKQDYYCCTGWAQSGQQCPLAICNPGCINGHCKSPNSCTCNSGWNGKRCEIDINECSNQNLCAQVCKNIPGSYTCSCRIGYIKENSNPQHRGCIDVDECKTTPCSCIVGGSTCQAFCTNSYGSFSCSCNQGFQLKSSNSHTCEDVNECDLANGGCGQVCSNNLGSYRCSCLSGYVLGKNKHVCDDVDECATLNGGCNQICTNKIGSFDCACNRGYRKLADDRTCEDINECNFKPCDAKNGQCKNLLGSYRCSCNVGFKLLPDRKTCVDINECEKDNACQHNCHNTIGSYKCSCNVGFQLVSGSLGKCEDVDECTEKPQLCQHICHNSIGSFSCSCKPGYLLQKDGNSCKGLPCETITAPLNGEIQCSGFVTDESCNLACHDGFNLLGSSNRLCLPTAVWSGHTTKCQAKKCPKFTPPDFGSTLMPCVEVYNSTCVTKCLRGFYMSGSNVNRCLVKDGKTYWKSNGTTCVRNTPCEPNPCLHKGTCQQHGTSFVCECQNTLYKGPTCNVGVLDVSPLHTLFKGIESAPITLRAIPDQYIQVEIKASDPSVLMIQPKTLYINKHDASAQFTITSQASGKYSLSFAINSVGNGNDFENPPPMLVIVSAIIPEMGPVYVTSDYFNNTCASLDFPRSCPNNGKLFFKSSCNWHSGTRGNVVASNNKIGVPLSLLGIPGSTFNNVYDKKLLDATHVVELFLVDRIVHTPCSTCPSVPHNTDTVNYVIEYGYFQRVLLKILSDRFPSWLEINAKALTTSTENLVALYGPKSDISKIKECADVDTKESNGIIAYRPKLQLSFNFLNVEYKVDNGNGKYCFLIDLCTSQTHIALPIQIDLSPALQSLGLPVSKLLLRQFSMINGDSCVKLQRLPKRLDTCVKNDMLFSVNGKLSTTRSVVSFDGDVFVDFADTQLAMEQKFDSTTSAVYKGPVDISLTIEWLGGKLRVNNFEASEMFFKIGGSKSLECIVCDSKGLHVFNSLDESNFQYPSIEVQFKPKANSHVYLPYDVIGGTFFGVEYKESFKKRIETGVSKLRSALQGVKPILAKIPEDQMHLELLSNNLISSMKNLVRIVESSNVVTTAFRELEVVKFRIWDLRSFLLSLTKRLDPSFSANVKQLLHFLTVIERFKIQAVRQEVKTEDQGVVLSYDGDLCIYKLCFRSTTVKVQDLEANNCADCQNQYRYIEVKAAAVKETVYSQRIVMKIHQSLTMHVDRRTHSFQGSFEATVDLFDSPRKAVFHFDKQKIRYSFSDVDLGNGLKFNVSGETDFVGVTWESLVFSIKGEMLDTSVLHKTMQAFYESKAVATKQRLLSLKKHQLESQEEYTKTFKLLEEKKKSVYKAEGKYQVAFTNYTRISNELSVRRSTMKSYLDNSPALLQIIEKDVEKVCALKICLKQCISAVECDTCQDEIFKEIQTLKCEQFVQRITSNRLATFQSSCNVLRKSFRTVYTGTCPLSSSEKNKLISTIAPGAAVGFVVGGPVGAIIGGIVGFISGLFSSCDKSYEVIETVRNVEEPCMLTRMTVKTVQRPISKCYNINTKISTGYSQPKECDCIRNPCASAINDPACVQTNTECRLKRALFVNDVSSNVPDEVKKLRAGIETLHEKLRVALVVQEKELQIRNSLKDEMKGLEYALQNSGREKDFAGATVLEMRSLLKKDVCLSDVYDKTKSVEDLFVISKVTFDTQLPVIDSIQMEISAVNKLFPSKVHLPVVYTLNDALTSTKVMTSKVLRTLVCQIDSRRKRRDVDDTIELDNDADEPFKVWNDDVTHNMSTLMQKSCNTFSDITSFLESFVVVARNESLHALRMSEDLNAVVFPTPHKNQGGDVVIQAQNELIETSKANLNGFVVKYTVNNVMRRIRGRLEVLVAVSNISSCFGLEDCIVVAFDTLRNLPPALRVEHERYIRLVDQMARSVYGLFNSTTPNLRIFKRHIDSFRTAISWLKSYALFCDQGPSIVAHDPKAIDVKDGNYVTLRCTVESSLPYRVFWFFNEIVLQTQASELSFAADTTRTGVYKCLAVSLTGNATSNETTLNVFAPPKVGPLENIAFYRPNPMENISLLCNVTGSPEPKVQWYFKSFSDSNFALLPDANNSLLLIDVQNGGNTSGSYYCRASNPYGIATSLQARVEVLNTTLAQLHLKVAVHVNSTLTSSENFTEIERRIKQSKEQRIKISYEEVSGKLYMEVLSSPVSQAFDQQEFFSSASFARQNLANTAAQYLIEVTEGLKTDSGHPVIIDNSTFVYESKLNVCSSGYRPLQNGFSCGQCPVGTSGDQCTLCPRKTYQSHPGEARCISCQTGYITEMKGSTKPSDCIRIKDLCYNKKHGNYRFPLSCSKYLVCSYTVHVMNCPAGLYFDEGRNQCNWPHLVYCDV